ncbi:MAG: hypothetical protein ICV83_18125 [Cytophagales bacterium]|nr:hypothetical protein [Cytophagales bacterium]
MELKVSTLRTHWISLLGIAASYWFACVVTEDDVPWEVLVNPLKLVVFITGGLLFSLLAAIVTYPILFLELILIDLLLIGYLKAGYVVTLGCILMNGSYLYCVSTFRRIDPLFDGIVIAVMALSQFLRLIPMRRIENQNRKEETI